MLVVPARGRRVAEALELSRIVLRRAEAERAAVLATSIVQGPAVVLGAKQRAGRVIDMKACEDAGAVVLRRATTGTAAWFGQTGLIFALALPDVATLHADATPRTLLNRNVRPFLKSFTKAGALANYFGREWISLRKEPAALLGFEVTREGAALIEVLLGFDESIDLPDALRRTQSNRAASLRDVCPDARVEDFATKVIDAFVDRTGQVATEFDPTISFDVKLILAERDPVPDGFVLTEPVRVPIGYLEAAVSQDEPARRWLGGDVLAPTWLYEDVAAGKGSDEVGAVAIDGATIDDLVKSLTTK